MAQTDFHPLVAAWLDAAFAAPTAVQRLAWPRIATGTHVLVTAPTGSGKTLAAFLWALDRLFSGVWPAGQTSVLYVSPLKALGSDIHENLLVPLAGISAHFRAEGLRPPDIQARIRSGDTEAAERRRLLSRPPEILITTPESLNLLLSTPTGQAALRYVRAVIIDEVHAVYGEKRGVHLMTAVERLASLAGEFQRIAISATVRPLAGVAAFVGGFRPESGGLCPRNVEVLCADSAKPMAISVRPALVQGEVRDPLAPEPFWGPVAAAVAHIVKRNRSTLVFVNTRRMAERIAGLLNDLAGGEEPLAYAHHGSLSREIRTAVERRLKSGQLKCIVATNSLELGIDVGSLDEVVLLEPPPSISSALQRIGRAGHRAGATSRGTLLTLRPRDLLVAAAMAPLVATTDIEERHMVERPLDVLAQVVVSMLAAAPTEGARTADLFDSVRACSAFRGLSRREFDLVLDMLDGRSGDLRLPEVTPRISVDRLGGTAALRRGARMALFASGGTIPDRGTFRLELADGRRIGELDEEFVWEARAGQVFSLGGSDWRIREIDHNAVRVEPAGAQARSHPFWRGEERGRDAHLAEAVARFLEQAERSLAAGDLKSSLVAGGFLDPDAAAELTIWLKRQREATGTPLPHRHHVLVEEVAAGPGGQPERRVVLHLPWGLRVLRPLAVALETVLTAKIGARPEIFATDEALALASPEGLDVVAILDLITPENLDDLLRRGLENSGFFGARFRECAGRALLLAKPFPGKRQPLWLSRLRSQRLFAATKPLPDFPIMLETWRTCLRDEFDMAALRRLLGELADGGIAVSRCATMVPSPMAKAMDWGMINSFMYRDDTPNTQGPSRLSGDLAREVALDETLRPAIERQIVREHMRRRRRLTPELAPRSPREMFDHVRERLLLPLDEWEDLVEAARLGFGLTSEAIEAGLAGRLALLEPPTGARLVAALQDLPRLAPLWGPETAPACRGLFEHEPCVSRPLPLAASDRDDEPDAQAAQVLAQWLRLEGPLTADGAASRLGIDRRRAHDLLLDLVESGALTRGRLLVDSPEDLFCDTATFETLLRLRRRQGRGRQSQRPSRDIPLFLAAWQGLTPRGQGVADLAERLERLLCLPLTAELWEREVLPARMRAYAPQDLDAVLRGTGLLWLGAGERKVAFCMDQDRPLLMPISPDASRLASLFPIEEVRHEFHALARSGRLTARELVTTLWSGLWQGVLANDDFEALRHGLGNDFSLPELSLASARPHARGGGRGLRSAMLRLGGSMPHSGTWRRLAPVEPADDALEEGQRERERARLLLARYGVVFRDLVAGEAAAFRWAAVQRSLRLLELAGECVSGIFFEDVPGPQFALPDALELLRGGLPADACWWICAADPASPCGLGLPGLHEALPERRETVHIAFQGGVPMLVSRKNGRDISLPGAANALSPAMLDPLAHLLERRAAPLPFLRLERVSGREDARAAFASMVEKRFTTRMGPKGLTLWRREAG